MTPDLGTKFAPRGSDPPAKTSMLALVALALAAAAALVALARLPRLERGANQPKTDLSPPSSRGRRLSADIHRSAAALSRRPRAEAVLRKQRRFFRWLWPERLAVLEPPFLFLYKSRLDHLPHAVVALERCEVGLDGRNAKSAPAASLKLRDRQSGRELRFSHDDPGEIERWHGLLCEAAAAAAAAQDIGREELVGVCVQGAG